MISKDLKYKIQRKNCKKKSGKNMKYTTQNKKPQSSKAAAYKSKPPPSEPRQSVYSRLPTIIIIGTIVIIVIIVITFLAPTNFVHSLLPSLSPSLNKGNDGRLQSLLPVSFFDGSTMHCHHGIRLKSQIQWTPAIILPTC